MVTLRKTGVGYNKRILFLDCLSTDTKPVDVFIEYDANGRETGRLPIYNGSLITEIDTGSKYRYDEQNREWFLSSSGGGGGGNANVISKTTAEWNETPTAVSQLNTIYVYTDYMEVDDQLIPAMKVGDGITYIVDLPFVVGSSGEPVTPEEVESWNNKVTADLDNLDDENLILSKT